MLTFVCVEWLFRDVVPDCAVSVRAAKAADL